MKPADAKVQAHTIPVMRGLQRAMAALRLDDGEPVVVSAGPSRASAATRRRRRAVRNARRANRRR